MMAIGSFDRFLVGSVIFEISCEVVGARLLIQNETREAICVYEVS
jgi:hypothetical protein